MTPIAVPGPAPTPVGDELANALAAYGPKMLAKVDTNRAKKKLNGHPMSRAQYVSWLAAGSLNMR